MKNGGSVGIPGDGEQLSAFPLVETKKAPIPKPAPTREVSNIAINSQKRVRSHWRSAERRASNSSRRFSMRLDSSRAMSLTCSSESVD